MATVDDVLDNCPLLANPQQGDVDGDGVGDACDSCHCVPNPGQGIFVFEEIEAPDRNTFVWPTITDIRYLRGDLSGVSTYEFQRIGKSNAVFERMTNVFLPLGPHYRNRCTSCSWRTRGSLGKCARERCEW